MLNSISEACAQAIVTALYPLLVYDYLLPLQTLVLEGLKARPSPLGPYSCLLFPRPKGHPGTRRKQLMRSSTDVHIFLGTVASVLSYQPWI